MCYNRFTSFGVIFYAPQREANDLPPLAEEIACTECKQRNYVSKKNKKNDPDRIEMMKHCKFCRKHTLHKETK